MEAATSVSHNIRNGHFMQIGHYHEDSCEFRVKEVTYGDTSIFWSLPHPCSISDHLEMTCGHGAKEPK